MPEILYGREWNEAVLQGPDRVELDRGLVSLLAFGRDRSPKLIGTAFISTSYGDHAVAISAAHNFHIGVSVIQNSNSRHHPSALREFLPNAEAIDLDRRNLRALYRNGDRRELCNIGFVAWDRTSDLAILSLHAQGAEDAHLFDSHLKISQMHPKIRDLVGVLGYADMATFKEHREGDVESATVQRRLVLRAGRVTAIHADGHVFCRCACIETSIPVFSGMSGGPAFLLPEPGAPIVPFGFISHDPDAPDDAKNDRSLAGSSIISLLPYEISNNEGKCDNIFRMENASFVRNTQFDRPTSVRLHFSDQS
jgi:hypothetical protein